MRFCTPLVALFGILALSMASWGCGAREGGEAVTASIAGDTGEPGQKPRRPKEELHPQVLIHTSVGDITVELDAQSAPLTVDNFLTYAAGGHYDKTLFHQVEQGFIALAGGYDLAMKEKSTDAPIRNEAHNGLKNVRGTIAMAREFDVVDGARSQFFFNLTENPALDHHGRTVEEYGYCVFGKVVAGLDVVDRIGQTSVRDTDQFVKLPVEQVVIESVKRLK